MTLNVSNLQQHNCVLPATIGLGLVYIKIIMCSSTRLYLDSIIKTIEIVKYSILVHENLLCYNIVPLQNVLLVQKLQEWTIFIPILEAWEEVL